MSKGKSNLERRKENSLFESISLFSTSHSATAIYSPTPLILTSSLDLVRSHRIPKQFPLTFYLLKFLFLVLSGCQRRWQISGRSPAMDLERQEGLEGGREEAESLLLKAFLPLLTSKPTIQFVHVAASNTC